MHFVSNVGRKVRTAESNILGNLYEELLLFNLAGTGRWGNRYKNIFSFLNFFAVVSPRYPFVAIFFNISTRVFFLFLSSCFIFLNGPILASSLFILDYSQFKLIKAYVMC